MTLLFMDGFQNYSANTHPPLRWGAGDRSWTWQATGGRFGQRCGVIGGSSWVRKAFPAPLASNTVIFGISINIPSNKANVAGDLFFVRDSSGVIQCGLRKNNNQALSVYRADGGAGVVLGTSAPGVVPSNAWCFVEWKVTVDDTVGAAEVRVNGATVLTLSGVDTRNAGTGNISEIGIGSGSWTATLDSILIDAFYACDITGSVNNDFLGDVRVVQLLPDGAGDSTQMTPSAGSNFQCVDENPFDSDTTYVQSDTVGHVDLYTVGNLPVNPSSIKGLQAVAVARKDDAGARDLIVKAKLGANTNNAAAKPLSTSYGFYSHIMEEKPGGGAWAKADVDSLQVGIEVA